MAISNASLSEPDVMACILFFADFQDLPLRGAFAPQPIHVPADLTDSDVDCAGFTFPTANSDVMSLGAVSHEDGGTDTLAFQLNVTTLDSALLSAIETPSLYVGRRVRVWLALFSPSLATDGGLRVTELRPLYRGYMTQPGQEASAGSYTITMQAENYLSLISGAQGRTYQNSTLYDPGDTSGRVQITTSPALPAGTGGGGGNSPWLEGPVRQQ